MNGAFYIGATGLQAQQRALDAVANNIANINTPTFKRANVRFSEVIAVRDAAEPSLGGVTSSVSAPDFAQGPLRTTGSDQDLAIDGAGFIEVLGPNGKSLLWRGGTMRVNEDGYLSTASGLPLRALISVPLGASEVSIAGDGVVRAVLEQAEGPVEIGRIDLVMAKDLAGLAPVSGGYYEAAGELDLVSAEPGDQGAGSFVQGSLETSNVQLSDEMVTLLLMQRAFAANAQLVQAGDQLMSIANNLRR